MKKITLFSALLISFSAFAQNTAFKLPAEIKFDKNVVQKVNDKKEGTLSYYFTTNGDYAALKPDNKEGSLILYSKEGNMMIVSEKEKSIIVMNMKAFMNKAKDMTKDRQYSKDSSASKSNFKKTGNTKTICGYAAEEYEITNEKGKMNIWYIKADFDSALALSMGMGKGPAGRNPMPNGDLENIPGIGKNFFMAEMEKNDKKVIETISITKTDYTFSSAGYTIRDMSDMMKGNYNQ
ncbi:MAG: DUF4412 domain-containing protein [Bacteroidota bacterium]